MRFLLPAALLFAAPAAAEAPAAPAPIPTQALNAHPALWVVKDADTTIYLFGTVHVLKPEVRWYGGPVKAALDSADELRLEIVEPDPNEMVKLVTAMAMAPATAPALTARLTHAQKARYIAQMTANHLPWQQLERFDPWFASITLSNAPLERLGYSPDSGVEKILTAAAIAEGKPVTGLETVAEQLGFFDKLTEKAQIALLTSTVDELPKMKSEFARLISAWSAGLDKVLASELNESLKTSPELAKVLLVQRNDRWAHWIADRMKQPGVVFIAVGAGHLAGNSSVQTDLARLGYKAVRIPTGK